MTLTHADSLMDVCQAAWRDGRVTEAERADLLDVARLVGVPAGEALAILDATAIAPAPPAGRSSGLAEGSRVVFMGDMSMPCPAIEALAVAAGLRVTSAVSAKTALVVAADP